MSQRNRGRLPICTCAILATGVVAGMAAFVAPNRTSGVPATQIQSVVGDQLQTREERLVADAKNLLSLEHCLLTSLDLDPDEDLGRVITLEEIELPNFGLVDLTFEPKSTRSTKHYRVLEHRADGSLVEVAPGPVRTVSGEVHGHPGSMVAGSMMSDGLYLTIAIDGYRGWIEPISGRVEGARSNEYVAYDNTDAIPSGGTCGTTNEPGRFGPVKPQEIPNPGTEFRSAAASAICVTELGIDADFDYYQDYNNSTSNVESRVNQVINAMNTQYQLELGLTHEITTIVVRTSSSSNPYSSNNAETLLSQFRSEWLNNQSSVPHDTAQLFTGRSITGSTIGIAWGIGVICTTSAYSLCESDCCGSFACTTDLHSHELGHLWGGFHCTCSSNTMNSGLTCSNDFNDTETLPSLEAHRDSRNCLTGACGEGGGEPPANDTIFAAFDITDGPTTFTNLGASTIGINHGDGGICDDSAEGNDGQINNDVWFRYEATCDGTATFSTCGTVDFDSKIAIYAGYFTPGTSTILACSDDESGCSNNSSRVSISVSAGDELLIRVGGHVGDAVGSGTLNVSCSEGSGTNGACCVSVENCSVISESACATAGGNWQGPGTTCGTNTCGTGPEPNEIELTDLCSWDNLGDSDNESWVLDLGVGAEVTGFSWSDIVIETVASNSWSSDIGIYVTNEAQTEGFYALPFSGQADGGPEVDGSVVFSSPVTDPNGRFYVELFECDTNTGCNGDYDEDPNGCDNLFNSGLLTVDYTPGEPQGPVCGDGVVEGTEECDDGNSVPDDGCTNCIEDEEPCPGDFDGDGAVGLNDFSAFLVVFGNSCSACPEDMDGNGEVDIADFSAFLVLFGTSCP